MYFFKSLLPCLLLLFCFQFTCKAQLPELSVQTGHTSAINSIKFSPDNSIFATSSSDNNIILWDLKSGKQINILSGHNGAVNAIQFNSSNEQLYSVSEDGFLITWDWKNGKILNKTSISALPLKCIAIDEKENKLFIASDKIFCFDLKQDKIQTIESGLSEIVTSMDIDPIKKKIAYGGGKNLTTILYDYSLNKEIRKYSLQATYIKFNPNNSALFIANKLGELKKWDLNKDETDTKYNIIETYSKKKSHIYSIETDSSGFFMGNKENLIYCYDKKGNVKHVLSGHEKIPKCLAVSKDGKLLLSSGEDARIYLWNTINGKLITTIEGAIDNISDIIYTKDGNGLILAFEKGQIKYWELKSNTFINYNLVSHKNGWEYNLLSIDSITENLVYLKAAYFNHFRKSDLLNQVVYYQVKWDMDKNSVFLTDYEMKKYTTDMGVKNILQTSQETKTYFNKKNTISAQCKNDCVFLFRDKSSTAFLKIETGHKSGINAFAFNDAYNTFTTVGRDGMIKIWSMNGELKGIMGAFNEKDFLLMNKENYYYSSKGALRSIGFRIQNKVFSFDQFDLKYNRPDLALAGFPYADSLLLDSYKSAYFKRLNKNGLKEEDLSINKNAPTLILDLPKELYSESGKFAFTVLASDSTQKLSKLFINVNGVPVGSKFGEGIEGQKFSKKIIITLNPGENDVQIYVTNSSSINSLKQSFKVKYKTKKVKPNLYFVSLGAGHYVQKEYNLDYAEKDAQDVISLFEKSKLYQNVFTKLLIGESVKKDSLSRIKSFISRAEVNDVIILFVAGHGILDKNLDYYLSTYDVDFSDPAGKGISYDALDNLLDNISCRKKVLLIDACHSGEIDKEEVEIKTESEPTSDNKLTFRAAGTAIQKKGDMKLKNSFELSKVLFADMRLNNGTTVISSAGGAEYALESSDWKNGAFTFCFLKGLKNKKADLDENEEIWLNELQEYLSITVSDLTNGKQVSTSRVENLQNNFRIW